MGRHRDRIMAEKRNKEQEIEEIRKNEKKHRRYYNFKQEFKDVFDEHKEITEGGEGEKVDMELIEGDTSIKNKEIL